MCCYCWFLFLFSLSFPLMGCNGCWVRSYGMGEWKKKKKKKRSIADLRWKIGHAKKLSAFVCAGRQGTRTISHLPFSLFYFGCGGYYARDSRLMGVYEAGGRSYGVALLDGASCI
ncbi:hypothetical protein F5X96DRAFT_623317 [Biscogniauxia mediterranea]|nr:hypothetical protein F5X96DRAFT_623317 [Biscogniauxia mediterranea]